MKRLTPALLALTVTLGTGVFAQETRYDELANQPFTRGFLSKDAIAVLKDEQAFGGMESFGKTWRRCEGTEEWMRNKSYSWFCWRRSSLRYWLWDVGRNRRRSLRSGDAPVYSSVRWQPCFLWRRPSRWS